MAPMDGTTLILITLRFSGIKKMKQFNLSKIKAAGTTVGDVYFPQTELLLPFDGANGATTTSDLSDSNISVTFNGNAQLSTAQSKFGGSSLYLDGGTSSGVSIASNSGLSLSGDFTIEMWIKTSTTSSDTNTRRIFQTGPLGAATDLGLILGNSSATFSGYISLHTSTWRINGSIDAADDNWNHVAIIRSGSGVKLFVNGNQSGSTWTTSQDFSSGGSAGIDLGYNSANSVARYVGYIDDFRITKGIARYTSSFTPPTTAHLTSAGDVNKQILINSTADGVAIGTGGINQARVAKAWVNFNGSGTVAIRDSYNVGSITDNGTGIYVVNFSTAMTDTNYSAVMYTNASTAGVGSQQFYNTYLGGLNTRSTSSVLFESYGGNPSSPASRDALLCDLIIFGN